MTDAARSLLALYLDLEKFFKCVGYWKWTFLSEMGEIFLAIKTG